VGTTVAFGRNSGPEQQRQPEPKNAERANKNANRRGLAFRLTLFLVARGGIETTNISIHGTKKYLWMGI
jgi:hypothetical protein